MRQRGPVPAAVFLAAHRVIVGTADPAESESLLAWGRARYPTNPPVTAEAAAYWAVGLAANYGTN